MIVKPLLNRLKSSSNSDQTPNEPPSLIRLYEAALSLNTSKPLLPQFAEILSTRLGFNAVIILSKHTQELKIAASFPIENSSLFGQIDCETSELYREISGSQQMMNFQEPLKQFPNDELVNTLQAKSIYSWPCFGKNKQQTGAICLISSSVKSLSAQEKQAIGATSRQIGQLITNELPLAQHSNAENEDRQKQLLETKTAELTAANKSLETISYAISHDLRAPLRTIDSFSKALTEDYGHELSEEASSYLTRTRKACAQMRHLIDDLLLLSRITRRKLEKQEINLSKLVENIAQDLISAEHLNNVELNVELAPLLIADQHLIKIALHHLLDNAIKFSSEKKHRRIDFFTTMENGKTVYALRDNGCGFDMGYYDKLFEPFKYLHTASEYSGTGIGLAIVQKIIARHNGEIWADSDPDQGSVFYFTLG